ncbi:MAG: lipopolysaccharide biosynthesis protein [Rhodospirillales bacterium]|nr:lipopolysaccharide biosynthesis protein [Rhodospirillales bacterium]
MSLRKVTLNTAFISSVSTIRLLAQFFVIPILSRILSPEDYGLMAMAMPIVMFTVIFADAGLGQSLIRSASDDKKTWSTSFWFTVLLGLGLGVIIAALAFPVTAFFKEPRLFVIILALAPVVLFQSASTIPEVSIRKKHRFGLIAVMEIIALTSGIATAVIVALNGGGAWALVAQQLVLYILRFVMAFTLSGFRPSLDFDVKAITGHLVFGRDVLGTQFVYYLINSADSFIVGRILGSVLLGFHTMAFLFIKLPLRMIIGPLNYVLYPHLVPYKDDIDTLRRTYLFLTRALAIVVFPGMAMVAASHHAFFSLFLSEKWQLSGEIFMITAPAAALSTVSGMRSTFMLVVGRADIPLRTSLEYLGVFLVALMCSVWFGLKGVAIGYSLAVFLYVPRGLSLTLPQLNCPAAAYWRTLAVPALVTAACVVIYREVLTIVTLDNWPQLGVAIALGIVALIGGVALQFPVLKEEIALLRKNWATAAT